MELNGFPIRGQRIEAFTMEFSGDYGTIFGYLNKHEVQVGNLQLCDASHSNRNVPCETLDEEIRKVWIEGKRILKIL